MSCRFENDVALYAGDDLPAADMARVADHLAACADCRLLARDLRESRSLLEDMRDGGLEEAMLPAIRARVMHQIGTRRPRAVAFWRPAWILVPLAAALLAALLLWTPRKTEELPRLALTVPPPAIQRVLPPVLRAQAAPARPRTRPASRQTAAPGPPVLVQLVTGNPDIVIYWLIDQKPQGD